MSTQPKTHELANALETPSMGTRQTLDNAAAELRRLHAANVDCIEHFNALKAERDELLEAACKLLEMPDFDGTKETSNARIAAKLNARAVIAKAEA